MANSYDPKCYQLAEDFLSEVPSLNNPISKGFLASAIQGVIEDFIESEVDRG